MEEEEDKEEEENEEEEGCRRLAVACKMSPQSGTTQARIALARL